MAKQFVVSLLAHGFNSCVNDQVQGFVLEMARDDFAPRSPAMKAVEGSS